VQLAILKLSAGGVHRVSELVALARKDFRDVLGPAEYPQQLALGFTGLDRLPDAERRRIQEEDRAQYLEWLRS
jgi:hypothetical protein